MISPRRIVAAVGLAASVTGLAALPAHAAESGPQNAGKLNPMTLLDTVADTGMPAGQEAQAPKVSEQLQAANRVQEVNRVNELHQFTDLLAPLTGMLPALQFE